MKKALALVSMFFAFSTVADWEASLIRVAGVEGGGSGPANAVTYSDSAYSTAEKIIAVEDGKMLPVSSAANTATNKINASYQIVKDLDALTATNTMADVRTRLNVLLDALKALH